MINKTLVAVAITFLVFGGAFLFKGYFNTNSPSIDGAGIIPTSKTKVGIGSKVIIPGWKWVKIVRFKIPISQHVSDCGIDFGGTITVKQFLAGDNLLVEYTAPGNSGGASCPSGVQFIVSKFGFVSMNGQYAAIRDAIHSEKKLVEKLLAQNFYGETIDAGDDWFWVDPIVQNFVNGHSYLVYGETCGIEGGSIQVRGEAGGRVLYEYTVRDKRSSCPGVLFFGK